MKLSEVHALTKQHLSQQAAQSVLAGEAAYHGEDNKTCSTGHLISNDVYDAQMERFDIGELIQCHPMLRDMLTIGDMPLTDMIEYYIGLQVIHDNYKPSEWLDQLNQLANDFNIDP